MKEWRQIQTSLKVIRKSLESASEHWDKLEDQNRPAKARAENRSQQAFGTSTRALLYQLELKVRELDVVFTSPGPRKP